MVIYTRCCKITMPQPALFWINLQAIASFIDLSRIVASARRAGRSANECSDRKNSEIYSLVYNDYFIDRRIIPRAPVTPCAVCTRRRCGFTTQPYIAYYFNKQRPAYVHRNCVVIRVRFYYLT